MSQLEEKERFNMSRIICFNLVRHFNLFDKSIGLYSPIKKEVDTTVLASYPITRISLPCIEENRQMSFRQWRKGDMMNVNKFGILEPFSTSRITKPDVIIVPLVAFDQNCNRIGYGGGYYDKLLSRFNGLTIGVGYEMQKSQEIEIEQHDVALNCIVTESKVYYNQLKFQ